MRLNSLILLIFLSSAAVASILSMPDFSFVPFDKSAVVFFDPSSGLIFNACLSDKFCVHFSNTDAALSVKLLEVSRVEFSARFSPRSATFYIQDRKTWHAFNHTTVGFDFSERKSLIFSTVLDSYGILPDEFVNLGLSLRQYEDGARILKAFAQVRIWNVGMLASMIYGGDKICEVLFFFSF